MSENSRKGNYTQQAAVHSPAPVLAVDLDGCLRYANDASWLLLSHWSIGIGDPLPPLWVDRIRTAVREADTPEFEIDIGVKDIALTLVPDVSSGQVFLY